MYFLVVRNANPLIRIKQPKKSKNAPNVSAQLTVQLALKILPPPKYVTRNSGIANRNVPNKVIKTEINDAVPISINFNLNSQFGGQPEKKYWADSVLVFNLNKPIEVSTLARLMMIGAPNTNNRLKIKS